MKANFIQRQAAEAQVITPRGHETKIAARPRIRIKTHTSPPHVHQSTAGVSSQNTDLIGTRTTRIETPHANAELTFAYEERFTPIRPDIGKLIPSSSPRPVEHKKKIIRPVMIRDGLTDTRLFERKHPRTVK